MQNTKRTHKLILDIGNSHVKYYLGTDLYSSAYSAEDITKQIKQGQFQELDLYAISTVESKVGFVINELLALNPNTQFNLIASFDELTKREEFLTNAYANLGIDRLIKLCATLTLKPQSNIILFDFGTATTMSIACPDDNSGNFGKFLHGMLAPGLTTSIRALGHYCNALNDYSLSPLLKELPKQNSSLNNTEAQIIYGCYHAHQGLISNWLEQTQQIIKQSPYQTTITIATGGHAEIFKEYFDLVLDGSVLLNAFFDKYTKSKNSHTDKSHQA